MGEENAVPDAITHLAVGFIASDLRGYDKAVFLLGSMLPDAKVLSSLLAPFLADQARYALFYAFDAPVVSIPLALVVSSLFRDRMKVFVYTLYAILLHLGLDLVQYKFGGGVALFHPASPARFSAGLFWQDSWIPTVVAVMAVVILVWYRRTHGQPGAGGRPGRPC